MATNKSYTDIEQSKKLAEILPIESADMYWDYDVQKHEHYPMVMDDQFDDTCIPCWSLAALLEQFENAAGLAKEYGTWFAYDNGKSHYTKHYDNPVDAAFEMVCWLKENKKL